MQSHFTFSRKSHYPILLIGVIFFWRCVLAAKLNLGNDEVYYLSYAHFPQWSYFDHPLLTGILIKISTLQFLFSSDFFYRLCPLILGTFNTWIIYRTAKSIGGENAGWIAALLFTGSFYASIIAGMFIMPDALEMTCWLLVIMYALRQVNESGYQPKRWFIIGLWSGIGLISKYHILLLWPCFFMYGLFKKKSWLRQWQFYAGFGITLLFSIPILYWNSKNNWISFTFHGDRITFDFHHWTPTNILREIGGAIFYNNPVNYFLIIQMLFMYFKKRIPGNVDAIRFVISCSLPVVLLFFLVAITRQTLPHWAAPAYTMLLLPVSVLLSERNGRIKGVVFSSVFLFIVVTVLAFGTIRFGWLDVLLHPANKNIVESSGGDITLDMYGWDEAENSYASIIKKLIDNKIIFSETAVIQDKWFPGSHINEYLVRRSGGHVVFTGSLKDIHHYAWINKKYDLPGNGDSAIFITTARYYKDPATLSCFKTSVPLDTISIHRNSKVVSQLYIYLMKGFQGKWISTDSYVYLKE